MWIALLSVSAILAPVGAVWLVWVSFPNLAHMNYRHELWRIRDEIVDDLLGGDLSESDGVRRLLRSLYFGIERAPRHTLRDAALVFVLIGPDEIMRAGSLEDFVLGPDVAASERVQLAGYLQRYREASARHMVTGTPLAWIVFAPLRVLSARSVRPQIRVEQAVAAEIAAPLLSERSGLASNRLARAC